MIREVVVVPDQLQLILTGNITKEEVTLLRERISLYIDRGHQELSIDLEGVTNIKTAMLEALVAIHNGLENKGGHMKIVGLKGEVKKIFELVHLDKVLDIR